jgi:hypothetical protein
VEEIEGQNGTTITEGWISSGNFMIPPQALELKGAKSLVMTKPYPKSFLSRIKVYTQEGLELQGEVRVNNPLKAGPWLIYQEGYDNFMNELSPWSSFLLVKDPFLYLAYTGFVLWIIGALILVIKGKKES